MIDLIVEHRLNGKWHERRNRQPDEMLVKFDNTDGYIICAEGSYERRVYLREHGYTFNSAASEWRWQLPADATEEDLKTEIVKLAQTGPIALTDIELFSFVTDEVLS